MTTTANLRTCVEALSQMTDEQTTTHILGIIEKFLYQRISFDEFQATIRFVIPPHQFHLFPIVASLVELAREHPYDTEMHHNNHSQEKDTVLKRLESLNIHFNNDKMYSQANQIFPKPSKTSIAALLNDEDKNVGTDEAQFKEDPHKDIYEDIKQFISSKPQLSSWLSCPSLPFSKTIPKLDVCGTKYNSTTNIAPKLRSSFEKPMKQKSRVRKEWTEAEDRAFLAGLKEFKLDFERIAQMIPGRNKAQIRTHYKYLSKSLKHNLNATVKRRIKMRGRPPRGRPNVTPSTLMQEMQACIEAIELERAQQQRDGIIKTEDSDEESLSSEIETPSASPRSSFSTESPRSSGEHDLTESMMSE